MCFEAWLTESQKQSAINFALDLLEHKCAPSAESGIAAVFGKDILSAQGLINFGKSVKEIFLKPQQAFGGRLEKRIFKRAKRRSRRYRRSCGHRA
jgi:hypothetical protein